MLLTFSLLRTIAYWFPKYHIAGYFEGSKFFLLLSKTNYVKHQLSLHL